MWEFNICELYPGVVWCLRWHLLHSSWCLYMDTRRHMLLHIHAPTHFLCVYTPWLFFFLCLFVWMSGRQQSGAGNPPHLPFPLINSSLAVSFSPLLPCYTVYLVFLPFFILFNSSSSLLFWPSLLLLILTHSFSVLSLRCVSYVCQWASVSINSEHVCLSSYWTLNACAALTCVHQRLCLIFHATESGYAWYHDKNIVSSITLCWYFQQEQCLLLVVGIEHWCLSQCKHRNKRAALLNALACILGRKHEEFSVQTNLIRFM